MSIFDWARVAVATQDQDGTWIAMVIAGDGVPLVIDDGFATEDEAKQCAVMALEGDKQ